MTLIHPGLIFNIAETIAPLQAPNPDSSSLSDIPVSDQPRESSASRQVSKKVANTAALRHNSTTRKSNVINLSKRSLSKFEVAVLEKGLTFCPSQSKIDKEQFTNDVYQFVRKLKLREHFHHTEDTQLPDASENPDQCDLNWHLSNSSWYPDYVKKFILLVS